MIQDHTNIKSGHTFDFLFPPLTSDTRSLDVVSIVTRLGIDDPELESGQGQEIRPSSKTSRTPHFLFSGYRSSFSRTERPGRKFDYPPLSDIEFKKR